MKLEKEVEFNGTKLLGIKTNEKYYIVIKNICENLGVSYIGQLQRIKRDEVLREGVCKIHTPSGRGNQETNLLELDYLPLWLTGIKANQCKEIIRPYLKEFKLKAKDVLASAFLDKTIDKPKQLSLPKIKEHKIIKKYYNGVPVMSVVDLAYLVGCSFYTIHNYAGENKVMINGHKMVSFKKENPNLPKTLANMVILYREEVINIVRRTGTLGKLQNQILAYFDDVISEPNIVSDETEKVAINENMKVDLLLKALPHLTEENLKNRVAIEVIKLVDNKILEEYENDKLHMKFIDSTEKILEVREVAGYRITGIKTDKPIKTIMEPDIFVSGHDGIKIITEKIK